MIREKCEVVHYHLSPRTFHIFRIVLYFNYLKIAIIGQTNSTDSFNCRCCLFLN